jgi:hypothetical protein
MQNARYHVPKVRRWSRKDCERESKRQANLTWHLTVIEFYQLSNSVWRPHHTLPGLLYKMIARSHAGNFKYKSSYKTNSTYLLRQRPVCWQKRRFVCCSVASNFKFLLLISLTRSVKLPAHHFRTYVIVLNAITTSMTLYCYYRYQMISTLTINNTPYM